MSIPKIPADGFLLFNGAFGFSLGVQQAEFPTNPRPGTGQQTALVVVEEIRISPHVAKMLLMTLAENIKGYEQQYGEIQGPMPPGRAN